MIDPFGRCSEVWKEKWCAGSVVAGVWNRSSRHWWDSCWVEVGGLMRLGVVWEVDAVGEVVDGEVVAIGDCGLKVERRWVGSRLTSS